VRVDPAWFRQAITNLIDNAIQHTPPEGQVTVTAGRDGAMLTLTVEDTGPGFSKAVLDHAFEPFTRSAGGPPARHQPTGLGLAVVQAIAEAHGGRAWAENLPNGGARVTMATSGGTPQQPAGQRPAIQ
jgi:signal transduction histidine kinase